MNTLTTSHFPMFPSFERECSSYLRTSPHDPSLKYFSLFSVKINLITTFNFYFLLVIAITISSTNAKKIVRSVNFMNKIFIDENFHKISFSHNFFSFYFAINHQSLINSIQCSKHHISIPRDSSVSIYY